MKEAAFSRQPVELGLFLGVAPTAGGMFQYAQSLAEALSKLDPVRYKVTIAYSDQEWAPILVRLGLHGKTLKHVKWGQRIANAAMVLQIPAGICQRLLCWFNPLVNELRQLRCDAWIFPAQEALSYQMPGLVVGTIHDLMHRYEPHFPEVSSRFRFHIREQRFRSISRACVAVLVDSKVGQGQVVQSYHVEASKIFSLPYVAPSYLSSTNEREDFDRHYQLPSRFLFYPAQFWPHKNHKRLIESIKAVAQRYPDVALVLSGGFRHAYEEVRHYAEALGMVERIRFVGYVPDTDLQGFYRRARALVMPTFFGPTNIPPLEAMALGCPALVSGIYGMFEQCGDAALYFSPLSVDEMTDQIMKVWGDDALAQELARKGIERSQGKTQLQFNDQVRTILDRVFAAVVQK